MILLAVSGCAGGPGARSAGTVIDDEAIESLARRELTRADKRFETAHFEVVSYDGVVLLAGQVQADDMRGIAQDTVGKLRQVRTIHNELTVSGPTSFLARSNDAWLTTKVKSKLIGHEAVNADRIKVVTENGVVYLMGKVPREQADFAVEIASTVSGVSKIVKVFEYLD